MYTLALIFICTHLQLLLGLLELPELVLELLDLEVGVLQLLLAAGDPLLHGPVLLLQLKPVLLSSEQKQKWKINGVPEI